MSYKNGIGKLWLLFPIYGSIMGLLVGLIFRSVAAGVLCGIITGLLYTIGMIIFVKSQEAKFDAKRAEIANERKVICDGGATVNGGYGGWLFLTEKGLEFYPQKFNFSIKEFKIPMSEIKDVYLSGKQILLNTTTRETYTFVVTHGTEWKQQIENALQKFC